MILGGASLVLVAGATLGVVQSAQANIPLAATDCEASWYGAKEENIEGAFTGSGEPFHAAEMTAAHRELPFGTIVKVTNKNNGASVTVRINDRGPFTNPGARCIDLSAGAFKATGQDLCAGVTNVRIETMPPGTPTSAKDPNFQIPSIHDCS